MLDLEIKEFKSLTTQLLLYNETWLVSCPLHRCKIGFVFCSEIRVQYCGVIALFIVGKGVCCQTAVMKN